MTGPSVTRVDFYLAEDPKEGRVTIDGQETQTPVLMQARYGGTSLLTLNGKPHLGPWEFHVHRLDGTVQKWTNQEQALEVAR